MGDFMAYLYQQAPYPGNVTGVPVSIDAIDPNGNSVHIATVTSNAQGTFGSSWTPNIAGLYTITATFAGDNSYGFSSASAVATAAQAPTGTSTPTSTNAPSNLATTSDITVIVVASAIAIIIAIAIVGFLILRKRL